MYGYAYTAVRGVLAASVMLGQVYSAIGRVSEELRADDLYVVGMVVHLCGGCCGAGD